MKLPGYKERSKRIAEACNHSELLKKAQDELYKELTESVVMLKKKRLSSDETISLNAIKHHLKLAGLEVERTENKNQVIVNITSDQAAKIQKAEALMKGVA